MDNLITERQKICEKCLLFKQDIKYGPVCDSSKYMSPDGTEVSYIRKDGWIKGCGCHMRYKWGNYKSKCTAGKW